MRKLLKVIFTAGCLLFLPCDIFSEEGGYIDVHIHLDPAAMTQQGISSADMAGNIISLMDRMGVWKAVLMPPPQIPFQRGTKCTHAECLSVAMYYPDRIITGGGGEVLNPMIYQYGKDEVTPEVCARFREEAEKLIRSGIVVFGEMAALHLSMQEHHIFSQVDPDHPLFLLLADIAAENNIPIDLHMEAVPQDAPTPESLLRASSHNPATLRANIGGLERLLEHNQNAKIVWQHIGWDNIGYMTTDLLRYLLNKHPNLYVAIRVERRMLKVDQSGPMTNRIVDNNWNVRPEWRKFIIDFSDRIVVGSDDFMGMARQQPRPKDSFIETWGIMRQFPEEIARKIGRNNAARIYLYR